MSLPELIQLTLYGSKLLNIRVDRWRGIESPKKRMVLRKPGIMDGLLLGLLRRGHTYQAEKSRTRGREGHRDGVQARHGVRS